MGRRYELDDVMSFEATQLRPWLAQAETFASYISTLLGKNA